MAFTKTIQHQLTTGRIGHISGVISRRNSFNPPRYVIDVTNVYDFIEGNFPDVDKPLDELRYVAKDWVFSLELFE